MGISDLRFSLICPISDFARSDFMMKSDLRKSDKIRGENTKFNAQKSENLMKSDLEKMKKRREKTLARK